MRCAGSVTASLLRRPLRQGYHGCRGHASITSVGISAKSITFSNGVGEGQRYFSPRPDVASAQLRATSTGRIKLKKNSISLDPRFDLALKLCSYPPRQSNPKRSGNTSLLFGEEHHGISSWWMASNGILKGN